MIVFWICLAITILAGALVLKPLFFQPLAPYFAESKDAVFDPSAALKETIAEIRADLEMGKLTEEDCDKLILDAKKKYLEDKTKKSSSPT